MKPFEFYLLEVSKKIIEFFRVIFESEMSCAISCEIRVKYFTFLMVNSSIEQNNLPIEKADNHAALSRFLGGYWLSLNSAGSGT